MKTVYVIGAESESAKQNAIKEILAKTNDVNVICVNSMEDIPMKERFCSDPSIIRQIYEIKAPPLLPTPMHFEDKKRKGHERPYKYHR